MSRSLTIRLDENLAETLEHVARLTGRKRSEVVRDALRRQLAIALLDAARRDLVPLAEARGWLTDEDVFREVS